MVRHDTVLSRRFWELLASRGLGGRVAMAEYLRWTRVVLVVMVSLVARDYMASMMVARMTSLPPRPGWTFHAKGLWYSPPGERCPTLTVVGSPNYGYRWEQHHHPHQ